MAFVQVGDARLFCHRSGSGRPALVFVHGLACAHEDWRAQLAHFSAHHTVVAPDLRGHGRSRECSSGFDIFTYGADIASLISDLALGPVVLVGHSMGCRVVLEAARRAPGTVTALVLVDGSKQASGDPRDAARAVRDAIDAAGIEVFMSRLFSGMFLDSSDPVMRERLIERAADLPPQVGTTLVASMIEWDAGDAGDALAAVRVPLLALQSTYLNERRERVAITYGDTTPWLELIRAQAAGARIAIVSGVGHFSMLEASEAVNRHIEDFVAALGESV